MMAQMRAFSKRKVYSFAALYLEWFFVRIPHPVSDPILLVFSILEQVLETASQLVHTQISCYTFRQKHLVVDSNTTNNYFKVLLFSNHFQPAPRPFQQLVRHLRHSFFGDSRV